MVGLRRLGSVDLLVGGGGGGDGNTYGDFEIYGFLCEGAHFVVEAEAIFSCVGGGEYKVALALFLVVHDDLLVRADYAVVDVEGAARLHLSGGGWSQSY